jgi:hypothetical protein
LRKLLLGDGSDAEISDDDVDSDTGERPANDDFFLGSHGDDCEIDESHDSHSEDEYDTTSHKAKAKAKAKATSGHETEGAMTYTYMPSSKSGTDENLEGVRTVRAVLSAIINIVRLLSNVSPRKLRLFAGNAV